MTIREKSIREKYASASDDILLGVLKKSWTHPSDVVAIVEEIWNSRPEAQKIRSRYDTESDAVLLSILKESSFYPSGIIAVVSEIWKSRGYKLPDNAPEPKQNNEVVAKNKDTGTAGYPLTSLCARWFCLIFEINLWLLLVGGTIGGGIIGDNADNPFVGAIIGFVATFVVMLFTGGLISVFLKLCADAAEIKGKLKN